MEKSCWEVVQLRVRKVDWAGSVRRKYHQEHQQEPTLGLAVLPTVQWPLLAWSQIMAMRVERAVLAEDDLAYLLWGKLGDGGPSPVGVRYCWYVDSGTGSSTCFAPRTYSHKFSIPGNLPCSFLSIDHSTDDGKHQAQPHHDAPSTETDAVHTLTPYSVPKQI
ncbi:hypothetical protein CNYM01_07002 [Colletotrichum nymphaeae SA-01]|uniref:Uncharacterized protein n=1 Tax=Colletotrichum nymphaeae SA-01 TaxID=1460502 RepID=A0A135TM70_9PEZI|nr:hypothetical protein CNYM01_07002 [Colletotrichum nymphaeae SA-01]